MIIDEEPYKHVNGKPTMCKLVIDGDKKDKHVVILSISHFENRY